MWFKRKTWHGRVDPRRGASGAAAWERFIQAGGPGWLLLAVGFFALAMLLDSTPLEPLPYRLHQPIAQEIYARAAFEFPSQAKTAEKRDSAVKMTPAVLRMEEEALQRLLAEIKNLPGALKATSQPAVVDEATSRKFAITPADVPKFAALSDPNQAELYNKQVDRLREQLLRRFLVTEKDYSLAYHRDAQEVRLSGKESPAEPKSRLLNILHTDELRRFLGTCVDHIGKDYRAHVLHYLDDFFAGGSPLYHVDAEATAAAEAAAQAAVVMVTETIPAGAPLVQHGLGEPLEKLTLDRLHAEHDAFGRQMDKVQPWRWLLLLSGRAGMVAAICVLMYLYIGRFHRQMLGNQWRGFAVAALLAGLLVLSKCIALAGLSPYLAVFPVFMGAVFLTIAYEQRFAFGFSGALVVLMGLQLRLGLSELLVMWAATATAVFGLREVRTRSKLIEVGAVTGLVVFAGTWAVEAAGGVPARFILVDSSLAAASALAAGFIAQGLLPLIERLFGVATSLTLLEWCDANKPLLKRLALEAPGTYSHSLLLGSMCETAAEAIGARGLLARVGAYFHDVGKINKPSYFVENQAGLSRHDRLSPAMSLLVIKGHVKDGLELAREYGLPRQLHEFIGAHHGTTLVEYFYHAAARRRTEDERAPEEVEFRYPGPRPHAKEAAILMLADASESAVRAMGDPSPGRIEMQVHAIVTKRLTDGQLDDCDLTLREVHAIESSLTKSLLGMYHGRVQYPSQKRPLRDQEEPATGASSANGTSREPANAAPGPAATSAPALGQTSAPTPAPAAATGRNGNGHGNANGNGGRK